MCPKSPLLPAGRGRVSVGPVPGEGAARGGGQGEAEEGRPQGDLCLPEVPPHPSSSPAPTGEH